MEVEAFYADFKVKKKTYKMESKKKTGDRVVLSCNYIVKKADDPAKICNGCALRVGIFGCLKRVACPDDGTGLNLFFEGADLIPA